VQENTDPNQDQDSANRSEYPFCGRGFYCVPTQDIDSVIEEQHKFGLACASRHSCRFGMKFTRGAAEARSKGSRPLDGRVTGDAQKVCGALTLEEGRLCLQLPSSQHTNKKGY